MTLCKLNVSRIKYINKYWADIIDFSELYIDSIIKSKGNKELKQKLGFIEDYIRATYIRNANIYNIIKFIIKCLVIESGGDLTLDTVRYEGIDVDILYKLITFGTLSVSGVNILTDAINEGIKLADTRRFVNGN